MAEPKRERTLYEIATSFFAVVVIVFAVAGMIVAGLGDDGVESAGFVICTVFLLLGLGRLYLGLRRGNEGAEEVPPARRDESAQTPARRTPRSRSSRLPHRRRP